MGYNQETGRWEKEDYVIIPTDNDKIEQGNSIYDSIVDEPKQGGVSHTAPTWEPDYPDQIVENFPKESIIPTAGALTQYYYVDLPWPLSVIFGPTLRFNSQAEAQAFVDHFISVVETAQKEAFPVMLGGLFGGMGYMTMKHPGQMSGVLSAIAEGTAGIIKGIGEVIPG